MNDQPNHRDPDPAAMDLWLLNSTIDHTIEKATELLTAEDPMMPALTGHLTELLLMRVALLRRALEPDWLMDATPPEPERPTRMTITETRNTLPLDVSAREIWMKQLEDGEVGYDRAEYVVELPVACTIRRHDGLTIEAAAGDRVHLTTQGANVTDPREPESHTGSELAERTVASISDASLLERAMRSLHVGVRQPMQRWNVVTHRFGLGSTFARQLCKRFDLDPDEVIGD